MGLKEFSAGHFSEHLCRSMEEKVEALKKYLVVTQSLRKRLDSEDVEGIRALLAQRQDLIRTVDRITANMKKVEFQTCPGKSLAAAPLRDRWNILCRTARELLEETASVDAECLFYVSSLRDKLRNELRDMSINVEMRRAHAQSPSSPRRFMDIEH